VNQRLEEYIKTKNISQADLSRMLNISRSAVSAWFNEKAEEIPPRKIIRIIELFKDLNARWLITGDGEMLSGSPIPEPVTDQTKSMLEALQLIRELHKENGELIRENKDLEKRYQDLEVRYMQNRDEEYLKGKMQGIFTRMGDFGSEVNAPGGTREEGGKEG
jgi:transcriptional regulator with XRE-family HTH domain